MNTVRQSIVQSSRQVQTVAGSQQQRRLTTSTTKSKSKSKIITSVSLRLSLRRLRLQLRLQPRCRRLLTSLLGRSSSMPSPRHSHRHSHRARPMPRARPRLLSRRCLGIDHCHAIWLAFLFARIYGPCYDSPYDSDKASVWLRLSLSLKLRLWTSNSACDY